MKKVLIAINFLLTLHQGFSQELKEIEIGCVYAAKAEEKYIIGSQSELNIIHTRIRSPHPKCASRKLPEIDFDKFTVVGVKLKSGGCSKPVVEQEIKTTGTVTTVYFTIKSVGNCRKLIEDFRWYLYPKNSNTTLKVKIRKL